MGAGHMNSQAYYSIFEGKVVRQFKEPTANSKTRVNKSGKTVHEEFYDYIHGTIVGIKTKDSADYGRSWVITMDDGEETSVLQLNYSSGFSNAFLKTLPNVDLKKPVRLIPKTSLVDGKKKSTLFVNQGGQSLKWYYTKDDPNGLPELKKKQGKGKDKGKILYDDSDVMEFLEEMVMTEIVPKLPQKFVADENIENEVEEDDNDNAGSTEPERSGPVGKGATGKGAVKRGKKKDDDDMPF